MVCVHIHSGTCLGRTEKHGFKLKMQLEGNNPMTSRSWRYLDWGLGICQDWSGMRHNADWNIRIFPDALPGKRNMPSLGHMTEPLWLLLVLSISLETRLPTSTMICEPCCLWRAMLCWRRCWTKQPSLYEERSCLCHGPNENSCPPLGIFWICCWSVHLNHFTLHCT